MDWSKVGVLGPKEEPIKGYIGEVDQCSICGRMLYPDDPYEMMEFITGLGRICVTCVLSEIESQSLAEVS